MKILELFNEQQMIGTIGSTSVGTTPSNQQTLGQTPNLTGNVQQLSDPKLQAASLAQQKQQQDQKKKEIADQIKATQQQLLNLQKQQQELNKLQ